LLRAELFLILFNLATHVILGFLFPAQLRILSAALNRNIETNTSREFLPCSE